MSMSEYRRYSIQVLDLDTAEALLAELRPDTGLLWRSGYHRGDWIFRGQIDSAWDLAPAALRDFAPDTYAFLDFIPGQKSLQSVDDQTQLNHEESFVKEFCSCADHAGHPVPGDHQELRDKDLAADSNSPVNFPAVRDRGMYALAQHFGIPTRLLDWTYLPLAAAYFATKNAARSRATGQPAPGRLAVWALDRMFVDHELRSWNPGAAIVTAPTSTNPNLGAQRGLFTLVRFPEGSMEASARVPTLDRLLCERLPPLPSAGDRDPGYFPVLVKFTLPTTEARALLRLLAVQNVTAATMFPGLPGVVESMREKNWHQNAKPGERS